LELTCQEQEQILEETRKILEEHGDGPEQLIPLLQKLQEKLGYLPGPAMERVAQSLDIPAVDVYELATFYNQFRLHPPGEHQVQVCMGTACYMVGGEIALDSFQRRLDINEGETTPDRKFSLERVACVGCCSLAPVAVVDGQIEKHVTPTRVDGILLEYQGNNCGSASSTGHQPGRDSGKEGKEGE